MSSFVDSLLDWKSEELRLRNARDGTMVASAVETALDSSSRRRGLLGRDAMPAGSALVIGPCNAIHTVSMRFPIDVLFVSKSGRVVKVRERVRPWRVAVALRAALTIELPAGTVARIGVRRGDVLAFERAPASMTPPDVPVD